MLCGYIQRGPLWLYTAWAFVVIYRVGLCGYIQRGPLCREMQNIFFFVVICNHTKTRSLCGEVDFRHCKINEGLRS